MKLGIIGVGFVGGTTATVLEQKHEVYRYDKYKSPYNTELMLEKIAKQAECAFICVPTPMQKSGAIDYSNIHNSIQALLKKTEEVGRNPKEILVIIRSTAVSGTTDKLAEQYPFSFAFNPEFLREKHALQDMQDTNRVVIGANEHDNIHKMLDIYKPLFPNAEYIVTDRKTAEMIKYAANATLASQVIIANEIFNICKILGVDYETVKNTILLDDRIGKNINVPGPDGDFGFGGKCFPKDLSALIHLAGEHEYSANVLREIRRTNEDLRKKKDWFDIPGATSQNNFEESDSKAD